MEARLIKKFLIIGLTMASLLGMADVYWLRDLGEALKITKSQSSDIDNLLSCDDFMQDKVIINGYSTVMQIGSSAYNFNELMRQLKTIDSRLITVVDGKNLIFTIELSEKYVKKYLVSNLGDNKKAVVFAMKLPKKLPPPTWHGNWDSIFGNGGAKLEKTVEYPDRHALYLTISGVGNVMMELDYIRRLLGSRGFKSISSDTKNFQERSDVFLNHKSNEMISVAFDEFGNGFIYYREGKKWE